MDYHVGTYTAARRDDIIPQHRRCLMTQMHAPSSPAKQLWISNLILGFGFALTGAGTVTLGVILPVLSARWALSDEAAGFLFLLQFLGSTLGAVFTGANRRLALRCGYALLAAGSWALAYAGLHTAF